MVCHIKVKFMEDCKNYISFNLVVLNFLFATIFHGGKKKTIIATRGHKIVTLNTTSSKSRGESKQNKIKC